MTPDELIVRVRNEARAVDVIGRRVSLKQHGQEHIGRCPFHDDQDPSLRVHPTRNVWNCSPCKEGGDAIRFVEKYESLRFPDAVRKIADELGIDEPIEPPKPQIVATYEYADQMGVVRGVKERWQPAHDGSGKPKSFRWVKRADPWAPTLYKLPEVITGIGEGKPIVIVEGEKCVDTLTARGFVATCNEDGAGKWETGHSEHLYGADVVIIPDADSAGRAHAKSIAEGLVDVAQTVAVIDDLPGLSKVKGDVFDWFAEGHTDAELTQLIAQAIWRGKMNRAREQLATAGLAPNKWEGPLGENAADLAEAQMPAVEWLVQGLLSPAGVHVLAGEPKGGKTWAETEIAVCVATGEPVFGEFIVKRRGPVLMICLEDGRRGLRNRLRATVAGKRRDMRSSLNDVRVSSRVSIDLMSNEDCAGICATALSMPVNPVLICIDPLRDANSGEESSNDDMRIVMHRARAIRDVTGATVLIVHHMSKPENAKGAPTGSIFNRFRGASAIRGAYDGGIAVETKRKDETNIYSKIEVELREGRGAGVFGLHLNVIDDDDGAAKCAGWAHYKDVKVMLGESMEEEENRIDRESRGIVAFLREQYERDVAKRIEPMGTSAPTMSATLKIPDTTLKRRLDDLVREGAVVRAGRGWIFNPEYRGGSEE